MSPAVHRIRYDDLLERDGEKCMICGGSPDEFGLEIDHINGNPIDHHLINLRLVHKKCNVKDYHRRYRELLVTKSEGEGATHGLATTVDSVVHDISYESKKNLEVEPLFRQWVITELAEAARPVSFLVSEGAERFDASPNTTRRWLKDKMAAPKSGPIFIYRSDLLDGKKRAIEMAKLKPEFFSSTRNSSIAG